MNSDKLADLVQSETADSSVSDVEMTVSHSEHTGINIHYRGRMVIPGVRSIMERDDVHVSDVRPDDFGDVTVTMRPAGN